MLDGQRVQLPFDIIAQVEQAQHVQLAHFGQEATTDRVLVGALKLVLVQQLQERGDMTSVEQLRLMLHDRHGQRRLLRDKDVVFAGARLSMVTQLGGRVGHCC